MPIGWPGRPSVDPWVGEDSNDSIPYRILGRRTDHLESVHLTGAALCVCAVGSRLLDERIADAARDGWHFCGACNASCRGWGVGSARQPVRPVVRIAAADRVCPNAIVLTLGRL